MIENWQLLPNKICSSWLLFLTLDLLSVSYASKSDVENHLEMGRDFVSRGQLQDALSHYHAAVEGDPENYLTYFKRGTVYLALGKSKFALLDFHRVLELKPDFHSARFQRGLVLMKQGEIEQAKVDFYHVHTTNTEYSPDAFEHYSKLNDVQYEIYTAEYYYENKDFDSAVQLLNKVIEACPWSFKLRELRSKCHLSRGDTHAAIMDLKSNTKLLPDNTDGYLTLSTLHYSLGNLQDALKEVRECLKLDPDHKKCFPHYKKTKKVEKCLSDAEEAANNKKYAECVENANKALRTEDKEPMVVFIAKRKLCYCLLHLQQFSQSLQYCQEALQIKQDPDIYCDKADVYIATEMYDDAIREYNKALNLENDFTRAVNGLNRAQKLQKQSERRDYYKILGVSRTATKQEITKAYRKAAMKWHPDNYQGDEKVMAQKKFVDIAAAKEVLTNPEKRQQFDNGEDPLDPESGQHQGGFNPFQHFQHFHSSPFHFKFHFN